VTGTVSVERTGSTVTLTLANPGKRNAIDYAMYDALEAEFTRIAADPTVRALVLRGGDGHYAGGTDITELAAIADGPAGIEYEARMARVQAALVALRIPVISVIDGVCVGGGLVFAALSDIVLATPDSRFGSPIAYTIGNTISPTSIARLHALLGRRLASEMLLPGRILDGREAFEAGFLTRLLEPERMSVVLDELLETLATAAPHSIASIKEFQFRLDAQGRSVDIEDVYDRVYGSTDFARGVDAFLHRRPPRFTGE